jgi:hypothetical protein
MFYFYLIFLYWNYLHSFSILNIFYRLTYQIKQDYYYIIGSIDLYEQKLLIEIK